MSLNTHTYNGYGNLKPVRSLFILVCISLSLNAMAASKLQQEGLARMRGFFATGAYHQALQEAQLVRDSGIEQLTLSELALFYKDLGQAYAQTAKWDSAQTYYTQAIELFIDQNDFVNLSKAYSGLGSCFEMKGDYPKAMTHFVTALGYAERQSDRLAEIVVNNNLAILQRELNDYDEAEERFNRAINLMTDDVRRREPSMEAILWSNLSTVYIARSMPDSAEILLNLAEELRPDNAQLLYGYNQLRFGQVYMLQESFEHAKLALNRSLEVFSMTDHAGMRGEASNELASLYIHMESWSDAKQILSSNLALAQAIGSPTLMREARRLLALVCEKQGKFEQALEHSLAYQELNNQMIDAKAKANMEALQERMDAQNARRQIELLRKQSIIEVQEFENRRNMMIAGLFALFIIVMLIVLTHQRTRRANKKLGVTYKKLRESNNMLHKQREQLERLLRDKNRILSVIAHDIRSPLAAYTTIPPMLEVLLEHKSYDRIYDVAEGMEKSTEKLNNLVNNLLEWALSQEHGSHQIVEAEIPSLIKECIDFADDYLKKKKLNLDIVIEGDLRAKMDVNAFKTVFRNLVSNAAKYSDAGMPISIRGVKEGNYIKLSVSDKGTGMDEDTLKSLFDINKKTKRKKTSNEEGLGLAMILCKEIIDLNQWEIEVESAPGQGSVFTLMLPLEAA